MSTNTTGTTPITFLTDGFIEDMLKVPDGSEFETMLRPLSEFNLQINSNPGLVIIIPHVDLYTPIEYAISFCKRHPSDYSDLKEQYLRATARIGRIITVLYTKCGIPTKSLERGSPLWQAARTFNTPAFAALLDTCGATFDARDPVYFKVPSILHVLMKAPSGSQQILEILAKHRLDFATRIRSVCMDPNKYYTIRNPYDQHEAFSESSALHMLLNATDDINWPFSPQIKLLIEEFGANVKQTHVSYKSPVDILNAVSATKKSKCR